MDGKKKNLGNGRLMRCCQRWLCSTRWREETMTHDLDEVIVEADRNTLPGGFVANNDRVGILGNIKAIDVPFTQKNILKKLL